MKYELNHDAIAKQVFDKASLDMRARRNAEQLVKNAYDFYQRRGALLSVEQLDEIRPFKNTASFSVQELDFITKSENALTAARRRRRAITLAIIAALTALSAIALYQWRKAVKRERIANASRLAITAKQELDMHNFNDAFQLANESLRLNPENNAVAADILSQIYHLPYFTDLIPICIQTFKETDTVTHVSFNGQGTLFALSLKDSTVKVKGLRETTLTDLLEIKGCDPDFAPILSPDDAHVLVLKQDSILCLYKMASSESIQLRGHTEYIRGAYFLNKDTLISWGNDGYFKMWDVKGRWLRDLAHFNAQVLSVEMADDKTRLLATLEDGTAFAFGINDDKMLVLKGNAPILAATYCNDDSILTMSTEGLQMWSRQKNGAVGKALPVSGLDHASKVSFFQKGENLIYQSDLNGRLVMIAGIRTLLKLKNGDLTSVEKQTLKDMGNIDLQNADLSQHLRRELNAAPKYFDLLENGNAFWTIEDGNNEVSIKTFFGDPLAILSHDEQPNGMAMSTHSSRFITYSNNGTVKIWDTRPQNLLRLYNICSNPSLGQSVRAMYSPNDRRIVATAQSSYTKWFDPEGAQIHAAPDVYAQDIAFSPDGAVAVASPYSGQPVVLDTFGRVIRKLDFDMERRGVRFAPDGQHFCIIGKQKLGIWNKAGDLVTDKITANDEILDAVFTPDGKAIATASRDSFIVEWDLQGNRLRTLVAHERILSFSFSKDGKYLLVGNSEGSAALRTADGTLIRKIGKQAGRINNAQFFPDGQKILIADDQNHAAIYDLNGQPMQTLFNGKATNRVNIFPDGEHLLVVFDDGIELWTSKNKITQLVRNSPFYKPPTSVSISSDNKRILLTFEDCTARQYLTPDAILDWLDRHPTIRFSDFDKGKYQISK